MHYQRPEEKIPYLEWEKMSSFRHVLVHDYYMIDNETVWKTIKNILPGLKKNIIKITQEIPKDE